MDTEMAKTDVAADAVKTVTVQVPVVSGTDGMVDAAALAKAALAAVAKAKETPKVEEPKPVEVKPVEVKPVPAPAPEAKVEAKVEAAPAPEVKVKKKPGPKPGAKKLSAAEKKAAKAAAKAEKKAAKLAAKEAKAKAKAEKAAAKKAKVAEKKVAKAEKVEEKAEEKKGRKSWGEKSVGQCGSKIEDLTIDKLNENEKTTLLALGTEGHRKEMTLAHLSAEAFPTKKKVVANYTVRNALRRLVRGGLVNKEGRGTYIQTEDGRKQAKKA